MQKSDISNMELVKEYPWLCPKRTEDGSICTDYDYSWTILDNLPQGWRIFILGMCKRIKGILEELNLVDKYMVPEAKEKYGALSWFHYMSDWSRVPQAISDTTCFYEHASQIICPICGNIKPAEKDVCIKCEDKI